MNKLVTKILKGSGVKAKVTNDAKQPKFRVVNNYLTLEGIVTRRSYSMKITDVKGTVVDELSVAIKNGNDIANRINESINTLNSLSPIYDNMLKEAEDAEFEDIPEGEPGDINTVLSSVTSVYETLMELAERVSKISNSMEENDTAGKSFITSIVGSLYDVAADLEDYKQECIEEIHGDANESLETKPTMRKRTAISVAMDNLSICEAVLKGHTTMNDICTAIKDIKSELAVRG